MLKNSKPSVEKIKINDNLDNICLTCLLNDVINACANSALAEGEKKPILEALVTIDAIVENLLNKL